MKPPKKLHLYLEAIGTYFHRLWPQRPFWQWLVNYGWQKKLRSFGCEPKLGHVQEVQILWCQLLHEHCTCASNVLQFDSNEPWNPYLQFKKIIKCITQQQVRISKNLTQKKKNREIIQEIKITIIFLYIFLEKFKCKLKKKKPTKNSMKLINFRRFFSIFLFHSVIGNYWLQKNGIPYLFGKLCGHPLRLQQVWFGSNVQVDQAIGGH